jgi:hypothetical protein
MSIVRACLIFLSATLPTQSAGADTPQSIVIAQSADLTVLVQQIQAAAISIENTTGRKVDFWLRPEDGAWTIQTLEAGKNEEFMGWGADFQLQVIGQSDKTIWRLTAMERWALTWNTDHTAIIVKKIVQ